MKKGEKINFSLSDMCMSSECKNPRFIFKDKIVFFVGCRHVYHKQCLSDLFINKEIRENNQYNHLILDGIIDESFWDNFTGDKLKRISSTSTKEEDSHLCYHCQLE